MSVQIIKCTSKEMEKNKKIVGFATGGVMFGKGMDKVNWKVVRAICDFGYTFMPKEKGVKVKKVMLDGVSGEMSIPDNVTSQNFILYIHGGGLVSGSAKATRGYCSMFARFSGMRVFSINYRLAPEHTYPKGLDDCFAAYRAIRRQYPESKICVTGESAGGYYTFALTVRCIEEGFPVPDVLLPQSPLCDLTGELKRDYYSISDGTVSEDTLPYLTACYAPGVDLKNPEISCCYFDRLHLFPPTMISCDSQETLRADSDLIYKTLQEKGVEAHMVMFEGAFHACSTLGVGSPETFALLQKNIIFVKKCFGEIDF